MPTNKEWIERWEKEDTPWNHASADTLLFEAYAELLQKNSHLSQSQVFVPLCGNSRSIRFFYDKGHSVYGLDLVADALERIQSEDFPELDFSKEEEGERVVFRAEGLTLLAADFFTFEISTTFGFIYDRASLVALEPHQRVRYVEKLRRLLSPTALLYLVTFEYEEGDTPMPPFSVPRSEVEELYAGFDVQECVRKKIENPREDMLGASEKQPELVAYEIRPLA